MMFRLTLGLILMLMGGSLVGNALLFRLTLAALPSRLVACLLGVLLLGTALCVILRHRTSGLSKSSSRPVLAALGDGFTVFGLASLAFNALMMIWGKCDLDPTMDGLHLVPAMLMNEVWEGLISVSGGSLFLTSGGIALFDACIGAFVGLFLFPFRRLVKIRALWIVVLLALFGAFEMSVIKWMPFRC
jgi:hypothetical protein